MKIFTLHRPTDVCRISNVQKGFTLVELLLSLTIIGLLAGLSLPVYRNLILRNDLSIATNSVAASLRRAQVLSQGVGWDSSWGVKIQRGSIIIFKGVSYTTRDVNLDESFAVPNTISMSGLDEIVFLKLTGFPQTTGVVNLSTEGDTQSVSINQKGMVSY